MFFTPFGYGLCETGGGGGSQWTGTQPTSAVFHPVHLKNSRSRNIVFDLVATENGHSNYVKHVLGNIHVFFTLFGYLVKG